MPTNNIPSSNIVEIGDLQTLSETIDWGLIDFAIPNLWTKTKGENITVMVVDTGISHHEDLEENILWDKGISFVNGESIIDGNGHGTMVAGVICAKDSNFGVVGVAPKTKIIPVKVLSNSGRMNQADALEKTLEYAMQVKPDIINMSLGSRYRLSGKFEMLLRRVHAMHIPVVCAMGNSGSHYDCYPAKYKTTFGVTSYNKNKQVSNFSSRSLDADFALPGENILTTTLNNNYSIANGTSFAAPFLSGIIALILSNAKNKNIFYNVFRLKKLLITNTIDIDKKGKDPVSGYGIINTRSLANII